MDLPEFAEIHPRAFGMLSPLCMAYDPYSYQDWLSSLVSPSLQIKKIDIAILHQAYRDRFLELWTA